VFRAKGLIRVAESDVQYIFHLVGQRFTLDESRRVGPTKNKLVLIGRDLDQKGLHSQLEECLTAPPR
jgi:G3E family GTPase